MWRYVGMETTVSDLYRHLTCSYDRQRTRKMSADLLKKKLINRPLVFLVSWNAIFFHYCYLIYPIPYWLSHTVMIRLNTLCPGRQLTIIHRSGGELYLANHLRTSQSACAKSTIHLCGIIVNRGDWLWSPANIKGANKDAKIYVGRSTTLTIFCFALIHYAKIT